MGFTALAAEETGVDFTNRIVADHNLRYLFATEKVCGGVAVGDVDGDGRPDLYFTNGPEGNRLFLQTEDLKFQEHTSAAGVDGGGTWSAGVAMVDIDGDGDLDIYVANYSSANQLFINRGDARFDERAAEFGLDRLSASHMPTFCDYDRDGDLDLYLLTNRFHSPTGKPLSSDVLRFNAVDGVMRLSFTDPALGNYFRPYQFGTQADGKPIFKLMKVGQPDVLFRNEGGSFVDVSEAAGIGGTGFGLSATWWDFNSDGWPDLWVGNDFDDPDRVYRNNRDGTFTDVVKEMTPHTSWFSMGADFADLDGDSKLDFLIADMSGTNHFKQKTNMGSMGAKAEFLRDADPQQYMRNALFLGTGVGRFLEGAQMAGLANSDWTWTVKLSDLDCDGLPDAFLTNGMSKNFNESDNSAVLSQPNETEWDRHVRAGTEELREQNLAFHNRGDLKFDNVSEAWGLDHVGMSFGAAHADLDRDGDLDLVVCNLEEPATIYRNDAPSGKRLLVRLAGSGTNTFGLGAKLTLHTNDGRQQVRELTPVRGYLASNEPLVHFGMGDALPDKLIIDWPSGKRQEVADLRPDHFYTIAEPAGENSPTAAPPEKAKMFAAIAPLAGAAHAENEFDDFSKQPLLPNQMSRLGPGQAWGDIDGDGDDDFWLGGAAGSSGQIWRNGGGGAFERLSSPALEADAACEDMGALWFDADGDGDFDLYVVSGGYEFATDDALLDDRLYLNDAGVLTKAPAGTVPADRTSGGAVAGADYDRDGDIDLFVAGRQVPGAYPEAARSVLLRNGGGKFEDAELAVSGLVTAALWSDVDGDGWIDLLLTEEWGPVRVFRNDEGALGEVTAATGVGGVTGWWNGIAGGDFDGDGDTDYVATNFGLNTKYHASAEHPALLYYGDFENLGRKRIVEAEFEDETLYPIRGRSCSSDAMPHLKETFTTFRKFAVSELTEIYQPEKLDDSMRLAATVLESGVFINETPEGGAPAFSFRTLPRIAQIAPSFGAVVTDANADGKPDIYLAQNFHSPQVETGHMAGGVSQLLLGDGMGGFSPVPADESGLVVGGDAASLTQTDLDGDGAPDLACAINSGAVTTFANKSAARFLKVQLVGATGNTPAVGATIRLLAEDGTSQSAEVAAGGGYLSQSSPSVWFAMPDGVALKELQIRWPDGAQTVHPVSGDKGAVEIHQQTDSK